MAKPDLPFELIASLSWPVEDEMAEFAAASRAHPWVDGADGPERVVIAKDLDATFKRYMPPAKYRDWSARQQARHAGSGAFGVGMAFEGSDGKRTAVLAHLGSKDETLALFAHEYLEAALDNRDLRLGFREPEDKEAQHGRALWGEYVVERARREISDELGWPTTKVFDTSFLTNGAREAQDASGEQKAWLYSITALDYAKALGRADAGVPEEQQEIRDFNRLPMANQAWSDYGNALRVVYKESNRDPVEHDRAIFERWAAIWRSRTG